MRSPIIALGLLILLLSGAAALWVTHEHPRELRISFNRDKLLGAGTDSNGLATNPGNCNPLPPPRLDGINETR